MIDTMREPTRVACCQAAPRLGRFADNCAMAEAAIRAQAGAGADIVVLPELVTSGYHFDAFDEVAAMAVGRDDPLFDRWSAAAGGAVVVAGFAERGEDGHLYNSAVVLRPGGEPVFYQKVHLWDREQLFFRPGADPAPVVDTPHGRVAVLVCYDLEFPEMTRAVALRGADLVAVPTNWPWADRPDGWPAPEVVIAMAAARTNRVAIACCDRAGDERGHRWNEGTVIVGVDGWPAAEVVDGVAWAELDLRAGRDKAIGPRNDVLADRRPVIYQ